jgi:hypothetical protein
MPEAAPTVLSWVRGYTRQAAAFATPPREYGSLLPSLCMGLPIPLYGGRSRAMSFRVFIYYCAVAGGWAAFAGWGLGRLLAPEDYFSRALVQGLSVGILVALGVSLMDALGNFAGRQVLERTVVAAAVGCLGGFLGALVGQWLVQLIPSAEGIWTVVEALIGVAGWTVAGLGIGASIGVFDVVAGLVRTEDTRGARRKVMNGVLGGVLGGMLGGMLHLFLGVALGRLFQEGKDVSSPSAIGFVALGTSIGLLIGWTQVMLKEAWVRVEAGFGVGREMILSKPVVSIGRAESSDIGLFGDPRVEPNHARIARRGNRYVLVSETPGATLLNERPVTQPVPLRTGDAIRLGDSRLRFAERRPPQPLAAG